MEDKKHKIHFIGIGGIGVSALARYYLAQGLTVSGSDEVESEIVRDLKNLGAEVFIGHRAENIKFDLNLVVYTAAVPDNNLELAKARKRDIKCQKYAEALGELTKEKFTIAVSGMHGKSTTTAMIGLILEAAGLDPTVILGTKVREWNNSNCRVGKSPSTGLGVNQYLVIEADEYDRSFLNYWPKILVLLNIEEEHLDTYRDLADIMATFQEYIGHVPSDGWVVVNKEDKNINKIISNSQFPLRPELRARAISNKISKPKFQIKQFNSQSKSGLNLKIPGRHNIGNANAALAVAEILGINKKIAVEALNNFNGTWRRMEYKGKINGAKIYDDYGHHPTEIKATLEGARELLGRGEAAKAGRLWPSSARLWCIFQPHQYYRTYKLFDKFVEAFNEADKLIFLPIYSVAGREDEEIRNKVSSERLAEAIKTQNPKPPGLAKRSGAGKTQNFNVKLKTRSQEVLFIEDFNKAADYLKQNLKSGDICLIMGAGDVYKLTEKLTPQ